MSDLLEEFETRFREFKQQNSTNSDLEDIDYFFSIRDYIETQGFVSSNPGAQVSAGIVKVMMSWANYLHGLVLPNTRSMISVTETEVFSDDEKDKIMELISEIMVLTSKNSLISLDKKEKVISDFIDDSVKSWEKIVKPELKTIMKKVHTSWRE